MKRDVFDLIMPDEDDEISRVTDEDSAVEKIKSDVAALLERVDTKERKALNKQLVEEVKELIRAEIAKIKPVQKVIEKTIETKVPVHLEPRVVQAPPAPPQIIRETRVEVQVPAKETKVYAEASVIQSLEKKIAELEKELATTRRIAENPVVVGGSGVIGIPPPEGNEGKSLQVVNGKASWQSGGSGAGLSGYTVNNGNELKTFDVESISLDELARVVGTMITELQ